MRFDLRTESQRLRQLIQRVEQDEELEQLWKCSNVMAIDRLGYTDHGPVHAKIVAENCLRLSQLLKGVQLPGVCRDYGLSEEYSEIVLFLAAIFHDLGMVIQRHGHEMYSAFLAYPHLERLLRDFSPQERAIIISEVLHAITSHYTGEALTKEAGILCVADALDMEKGRARIPFHAGKVDIHSVSALAIERVEILKGERKPVSIRIEMSNSAGIFQVDQLLGDRIRRSGLADYLEVVAEVTEREKKILHRFELKA
ncbi:MAG: HD domain-containing protein [Candidatus Hadarchaeales archaeon]